MADIVKESDLRALVTRINNTLEDSGVRNHGKYLLQGAYGGWQLQRADPCGPGVRTISPGYRSKREMRDFLYAFIDGLDVGLAATRKPDPVPADSDPMTGAEYGTLF